MAKRGMVTLILCCYAVVLFALSIVIFLLRPFLFMWKEQLTRPLWSLKVPITRQPACVFYCSSAGEYEQAKPLLDRLLKRGFFPVIIFFSVSGYNFAKHRDEALPYLLAPLDHPWLWRSFFSNLKPMFTIIIRHEFWPGFVSAAAKHSSLYIINYSLHGASRSPGYLTKWLLAPARRIFTVGVKDSTYLTETLKLTQAEASNDTKFDRVLERASQQKTNAAGLNNDLKNLANGRHIIVLGSAWQADVTLILSGWRLLDPALQEQYYFVIVPHDISAENLATIHAACLAHDAEPEYYAKEKAATAKRSQILVIDVLGMLAEVYAGASSCFVGGALHHRVHNVLEPAAYNLDIAFGPRYETQREAQILVQEKLVAVCENAQDAAGWLVQTRRGERHGSTLDFVKRNAGASGKIEYKILVDIGHE